MASIKPVLKKNQKADGTYPLNIRVTKDRKTVFIPLDYDLHEKDWDEKACRVKKSHPNSTRLNNLIIKRLSEATDTALEVETKNKKASSKEVKQKIKPTVSSSLFAQADLYIARLEVSNHNCYSADKPRVGHIKAFFKDDLAFQEITVDKVKALKIFLKSEYKMSERTALNHLSVLRSIFRQAIDAGICTEDDRPFGKKKVTIKFPDSKKTGLSVQDIAKLESVELTGRRNDARNMFLFSYYTAGTRVSDVFRLNWNDINDGRLHYVMGKNNKGGSLRLPDKALTIVEMYRENNPTHNLVFPELKHMESLDNDVAVQSYIKTRLRGTNELLKELAKELGITKKVTMHISRHTFGQLASDKIPIQVLQQLYRHSNLSTTANYQSNFTNKDTDDALDKVLGL